MNKATHLESDLDLILTEIRERFNITGVLFAYRDGAVIKVNISEDFDDQGGKEFIAMCASVLGNAEGLGQTMGDKKIGKIISELDDYTIIIVGCDESTFLAVIINNDTISGPIQKHLDDYIKKLIDAH